MHILVSMCNALLHIKMLFVTMLSLAWMRMANGFSLPLKVLKLHCDGIKLAIKKLHSWPWIGHRL